MSWQPRLRPGWAPTGLPKRSASKRLKVDMWVQLILGVLITFEVAAAAKAERHDSLQCCMAERRECSGLVQPASHDGSMVLHADPSPLHCMTNPANQTKHDTEVRFRFRARPSDLFGGRKE